MDKVILVDQHDNEIGFADKMEAHQKGLLHRAFSIFIFNSGGQLLLQKRTHNKYHSGGLWSNTCCSHPRPGEKTPDAAKRRLWEEMGLRSKLQKAFNFSYRVEFANGLVENEFDYVFIGLCDMDPNPDPREVADWKYVDVDFVLRDSVNQPEQYTFWFKKSISKVLDYLHRNPVK